MHQFQKTAGIVTSLIMVVGAFFKTMYWPGAGILIVSGTGLFLLLFVPSALIHSSRKATSPIAKAWAALSHLTLALIAATILFKIMHWPFASQLLMTTIGTVCLVLAPLYAVRLFRQKAAGDVLPIAPYGIVLAALLLMPVSLKVSQNYDRAMRKPHQQLEQSIEAQKQLNAELVAVQQDDRQVLVHKEAQALLSHLEQLKEELIASADGVPQSARGFDQLRNTGDVVTGERLLWAGKGKVNATTLYEQLKQYRNNCLSLVSEEAFHAHGPLTLGTFEEWSNNNLVEQPLISLIPYLSQLQSEVTQLETYVLMGKHS